jgi:hypothetical protein
MSLASNPGQQRSSARHQLRLRRGTNEGLVGLGVTTCRILQSSGCGAGGTFPLVNLGGCCTTSWWWTSLLSLDQHCTGEFGDPIARIIRDFDVVVPVVRDFLGRLLCQRPDFLRRVIPATARMINDALDAQRFQREPAGEQLALENDDAGRLPARRLRQYSLAREGEAMLRPDFEVGRAYILRTDIWTRCSVQVEDGVEAIGSGRRDLTNFDERRSSTWGPHKPHPCR